MDSEEQLLAVRREEAAMAAELAEAEAAFFEAADAAGRTVLHVLAGAGLSRPPRMFRLPGSGRP